MKLVIPYIFDKYITTKITEKLMLNSIQFFNNHNEYGLEAHGSGTLFKFNDNYFIITASHVLIDEDITQLRIQVGNTLYRIDKESILGVTEKSYNRNNIDIAVVKLCSGALITELKAEKKFIELKDMNFDSKQKIHSKKREDDYYFLFGFPASKTFLETQKDNDGKAKKIFNITAYCQMECMYTNPPRKLIEKKYDNHLFFNKNKKGSNANFEGRIIKPKLNGMSGGGLWELSLNHSTGEMDLKHVGIFTEVRMGIGISVKSKFAIELIREGFKLNQLPRFNNIFREK